MGKRSANRGSGKKERINVKQQSRVLPAHKRNEISDTVKKLLKAASQVAENAKEGWDNHIEVMKLVEKIRDIEPDEKLFNREENFPLLMEWLKNHNGVTDNVTISKYEDMEYGLQATRNLNKMDKICAVPEAVMMTLENVKQSPLNQLYNSDPILKNMGNVALALFLLLEYLKGENSFWFPYISTLPEKYNTVLYFSADDFKELKCSPSFGCALKQFQNIARQYAYFYQVFQKSEDEASRLLRHNFTYHLYRWAVSTVMTRQNFIPNKEGQSVNALIPLWDMCNHTNGHLSTEYNPELNRSECFAFKNFKKGEQVLIFYGKRSNSDFLLHNGFVYAENEHDTYCLKLGISKADPLYEGRTKLLSNLGIPTNGEFHLRCGSEPLDGNLLAFLRIFNMDEGNLKHWLESDKIADLGCGDCALDTAVECKVWNFLYNRVKLLLLGYNSSISKGETQSTSPTTELVRKLCALEKKLLQSVSDYVQERLKA